MVFLNTASDLSARKLVTLCFITAFAIAAPVAFTQMGELSGAQIFLMALFVMLFGLPHGAFDGVLAVKMGLVVSIKTAFIFSALYILLAAAGGILWLLYPSIGLTLFLVISIYHFSDDWTEILPRWLSLTMGVIVITMPAFIHGNEVSIIFQHLYLSESHATALVNLLYYSGIIGSISLACGIVLYRTLPKMILLEVITVWLAAMLFSPLLFFVIYFCFLHSVRHLTDCAQKLDYSARDCYMKSLPILILTLLIAALGYHFFNTGRPVQDILRFVFIGLFALTIPHICLITFWYRSREYCQKGRLR